MATRIGGRPRPPAGAAGGTPAGAAGGALAGRRLAGVLVATVLLAAACSGGGGQDRGPATSAPATTATSGPDASTSTSGPPVNRPADGRPSVAVAATAQRLVVVDTFTGGVVRVLHRAAGTDRIAGLSLTPDGLTVYFAMELGDCLYGVFRVPVAGGGVQRVASGIAAALSPDGRLLAYAAGSGDRGGPAGPGVSCTNTLVVRDLTTDIESVWLPPVDGFGEVATLTRIAWAPDNRRLAFEQAYEGGAVRVLDTAVAGSLDVAVALPAITARDGFARASSPVWLPDGARLALLATCCGLDPDPTGTQVLAMDVATGATTTLARLATTSAGIDLDGPGTHLIYVDGDGNLRVSAVPSVGRPEAPLGGGYIDAAW